MKAALKFNDIEEAKAVARRLSELASGLQLTVVHNDCVVTDGTEFDEEQFDIVVDELMLDRCVTVSMLLDEMCKIYKENHGEPFYFKNKCRADTIIIGLTSKLGNAGVTVIAVMLASVLAGRITGRVVLISEEAAFGAKRYMNFEHKSVISPMHLSYMVRYDEGKWDESLLSVDSSGFFYAEVAKSEMRNLGALAKLISVNNLAEIIIVDFGKSAPDFSCDAILDIENYADIRNGVKGVASESSCNYGEQIFVKVKNNAVAKGIEDGLVSIPYDPQSFNICEERIEVSRDRIFAAAVGEFAENIMKMLKRKGE